MVCSLIDFWKPFKWAQCCDIQKKDLMLLQGPRRLFRNISTFNFLCFHIKGWLSKTCCELRFSTTGVVRRNYVIKWKKAFWRRPRWTKKNETSEHVFFLDSIKKKERYLARGTKSPGVKLVSADWKVRSLISGTGSLYLAKKSHPKIRTEEHLNPSILWS